MLNMIEEGLQSSSSSTPLSPTSSESSFLSSSNSENLNPTAYWNLDDLLERISIDDYDYPLQGTEGSDDGIYEYHRGLNPSSERIVELLSEIHKKLGELMINRSSQDVLVAAETVRGESDYISFLESFLNNLNINGVQGEAYTERQELSLSSGNMEPVGVEYSSVAVTSSRSPVESEEIVASVDSSPSPMIRPPPQQNPLPRTNWMLNGSGLNSFVQPDSRPRIVNKIMEALKSSLPVSGQEGLHELNKIAIRIEEIIYTDSNSNKSPDAAPLDYSTAQTGHANGADWQEEVYQKIKTMKDLYLPEISEMYQKIAAKLQQHDSLPQQSKSDQLEKLKIFKTMLERIITFLQVSKNNISPGYKEKLGSYERQIVNFIHTNRPRKPALQQGQLPAPHMQTMQQPPQLTQIQSHEIK